MTLSEHAAAYVKRNGLRAKVIVSNCRRFERFTSIAEPERISTEVIAAFRAASLAMSLSSVTTEKTITDVMTILRDLGHAPGVGKRLRRPRPEPHPVSMSDINAIFDAAQSQRLRRWLAIAFWTGLRLSDSIIVYVTVREPCDTLRHQASKTGHNHAWPVPEWLRQWLPRVEPLTGHSVPWFGELIRRELAATCDRAGVNHATPKQVRQASVTEWTRANATAGAIVHGSGLGVMAHYLDPLSVLESAATRVRLPECFGACNPGSDEDTLLTHFRRLDPAAQQLVAGTAERLAAG